MAVVVTGARGLLGGEFVRQLRGSGDGTGGGTGTGGDSAAIGWSGGRHEGYRQVDVRSAAAVQEALDADRPTVVIHCAADADIASCERDPDAARALNALAVRGLVAATAERGIRLVQLGTDYVFSGAGGSGMDGGYTEDDPVDPLQVYGRTKAEAERYCAESDTCLVVRATLLFGVGRVVPRSTFPEQVGHALLGGGPVDADAVEIRQPARTSDVCATVLRLVEARAAGIVHVAPVGTTTKYGWARRIAELLGRDPGQIRPTEPAPGGNRPPRSTLLTPRLAALGIEPPAGFRASTPPFLREVGVSPAVA